MARPRLLITMGDVAGIGPEVIAGAWREIVTLVEPVVIGDRRWLEQALLWRNVDARVEPISHPDEARPSLDIIPCLGAGHTSLSAVHSGEITAAGGQAAYDFLIEAIDRTLAGQADGIVTAPLHKEGLHAAGIHHPGHTEILAERCGTSDFAMVLHGDGVAIAHVTLHQALKTIFADLTTANILAKIRLLHNLLPRLLDRPARLAVASLNPHCSDGGLFGDEETTLIAPAVAQARAERIEVSGPFAPDTLFLRAFRGEFDGVVAMYHDQGHIAMKLRTSLHAVNISAGLPIVRTSVAHGTAYDIAGKGIADPGSMIAAVKVASRLCRNR